MITCEKLVGGKCVVASDIAGMEVTAVSDACEFCLSCEKPKSTNKATASMAVATLINSELFDARNPSHLELKKLLTVELPTTGPGTELKKLISWFPIPGKSKCRTCKNLELKMNLWGPDKCELKTGYIVKKLKISAKRKGVPYTESLLNVLVTKAIRNARANAVLNMSIN